MMSNLQIETLDDFLPEPLAYREQALKEKFYDIRGPDGVMYRNINVRPSDEFEGLLSNKLGRSIRISYGLLRRNFEGEPPNFAVHSDNGYDQFAAILYLSRPGDCRGGTAFWEHKQYGWTHWPDEKAMRRTCKKPEKIIAQLQAEANEPTAWEQTYLAEMRFNRMIVYPTNQFHSRWPWNAWGNSPEDCRMIWVGFFSEV
jgi:hypothetical protein